MNGGTAALINDVDRHGLRVHQGEALREFIDDPLTALSLWLAPAGEEAAMEGRMRRFAALVMALAGVALGQVEPVSGT